VEANGEIIYKLSELSFQIEVRLFCFECHGMAPESTISNRREPKSCLGLVFNFKLGSFNQ